MVQDINYDVLQDRKGELGLPGVTATTGSIGMADAAEWQRSAFDN